MSKALEKTIYLDHNATTPLDSRVLEAMMPYLTDHFGNPASASHSYGWDAESAMNQARAHVAAMLNCLPQEVYFTSGSTEANNWVFHGLIEKWKTEKPNVPCEIVSSPIEHQSVLKCLSWAEKQGAKVRWAQPNKEGVVSADEVARHLTPDTQLVSLMWVQNEIGSINPISEIAALCKQHQVYLHTDATQAIGKLPIHFRQQGIGFLSLSAHKFYGPKGIGALIIRQKEPKISWPSFFLGGGHERGLRSGTPNVPAIVGLGEAAKWIDQEKEQNQESLRQLQKFLWSEIQKYFPQAQLNGPALNERAANNLNVTFVGHQIPATLNQLAVSRGSACASGTEHSSHVLKALGLDEKASQNTIRFSLGRTTTKQDLETTITILRKSLGQ